MAVQQLITTPISMATNAIKMNELAQKINSIMKELGNQEYSNARRALDDAERSPDPRPLILDGIAHLRTAASNFKNSADRVSADRTSGGNKLRFLSLRCDCYALALKTWSGLQGEDSNEIEAAKDYRDAVSLYIRTGKEIIKDQLWLEKGGFGVNTYRFVKDLGSQGAMGNSLNSGHVRDSSEEKKENREEARKTLKLLSQERETAVAVFKGVGISNCSPDSVPEKIDQIVKLNDSEPFWS